MENYKEKYENLIQEIEIKLRDLRSNLKARSQGIEYYTRLEQQIEVLEELLP